MEGNKGCFLALPLVELQKAPNSIKGNLSQKSWNLQIKEELHLHPKKKNIPLIAQ